MAVVKNLNDKKQQTLTDPKVQGVQAATTGQKQTMGTWVDPKQQGVAQATDQGRKQDQSGSSSNAYNGLAGVSQNTAQQVANNQNYQAGAAVQQANQALQSLLNNKPQGYESKYGQQLESILQQITNQKQFKYSFNGDELFKSYADQQTQRGKQASLDAMGQAAGLTGGYGNSYGQMVGQQQYQQNLTELYDRGMDLYDRAYQRYQDEQNGLYDQYNVLAGQDQTEYGRYRDKYNDWLGDREYYTGRYDTESANDYQRYQDQRDYWTQLAQIENADYRTEQERQEAIRQFEMQFAENQRQYNETMAENRRQWDAEFEYNKMTNQQKYAYETMISILEKGQMPTDTLLQQAGISKADAQKMMKQIRKSTGGGRRTQKAEDYYLGPNGTYLKKDQNGNLVEVNYNDIPDNANIHTQDKLTFDFVPGSGPEEEQETLPGFISKEEYDPTDKRKK